MNYFFMAIMLFILSCGSEETPPDGYEPPIPVSRRDILSSWSGSRNLIAYFHYDVLPQYDPDSTGIYTIKPDGSEVTFFYCWPDILGIDWSPDGGWIAVNTRAGLYKISFPDSQIVQLTGPGEYFEPVWSPDGNRIACSWRTGEIRGLYLINSDGSNYHRIVLGDYASWFTNDSIYYINHANETEQLPTGAICLTDTAGTFQRLVLDHVDYDTLLMLYDIESHGFDNRLVFQTRGNYPHMTIWAWEPSQTNQRPVAIGAENPYFSPNGEEIVYTNLNWPYGNLWIVNWNGTGRRQLTE